MTVIQGFAIQYYEDEVAAALAASQDERLPAPHFAAMLSVGGARTTVNVIATCEFAKDSNWAYAQVKYPEQQGNLHWLARIMESSSLSAGHDWAAEAAVVEATLDRLAGLILSAADDEWEAAYGQEAVAK